MGVAHKICASRGKVSCSRRGEVLEKRPSIVRGHAVLEQTLLLLENWSDCPISQLALLLLFTSPV